jgi:hypothetical protein
MKFQINVGKSINLGLAFEGDPFDFGGVLFDFGGEALGLGGVALNLGGVALGFKGDLPLPEVEPLPALKEREESNR